MIFQSRLSALLGLAILSLCNIALVNAGDENTVYAVQANVCTYRKHKRWQVFDTVHLAGTPAKIIGVPVGQTCAISYDLNEQAWVCKPQEHDQKGTAITVLKLNNHPDLGEIGMHPPTKRPRYYINGGCQDAYIVGDSAVGSSVVWSNTGYAVISQPDNTYPTLCIKKGSRHPRVFGVTLTLQASVGLRSKGWLTKGRFRDDRSANPLKLVVANRPPGIFPPVWELTYEGEYKNDGKWRLKLMNSGVYAEQVVGRGIAIKAIPADPKQPEVVQFNRVRATSWPPKHGGKSTVAYIVPSSSCHVFFRHGKARIYDVEHVDPTNHKRRPAINIQLGKYNVSKPAHPKRVTLTNSFTEGNEANGWRCESASDSCSMGSGWSRFSRESSLNPSLNLRSAYTSTPELYGESHSQGRPHDSFTV